MTHLIKLWSPLFSIKALFRTYTIEGALKILKTYILGGESQAKIRCGKLEIHVSERNVREAVELARKLERVIKAGGKSGCYYNYLYIDLNGKWLCRTSKLKTAIDDILIGPLLGVAYEVEEYEYMERLFKHIIKHANLNDVLFVDVGSYIGGYAVRACKHGIEVMTIEPHPNNYSMLLKNLKINNCKYIALNIAAGKDKSIAYLCEEENGNLASSYIIKQSTRGAFKVKVFPLDEIIPRNKKLFVKIDVEGKEVEVLEGMKDSLNNVCWMMIEVAERNMPKVINIMKKNNMKLLKYIIRYGASKRYQIEFGSRYFNLFFINHECYKLVRNA